LFDLRATLRGEIDAGVGRGMIEQCGQVAQVGHENADRGFVK
jgi:hypothetical protein